MKLLERIRGWLTPAPKKVLAETLAQHKVDIIQRALEQLPQADCPLIHRFTPGLYFRELLLPKGTLAVTKIHKSEHPFVITKGEVSIWIDGVGVKKFQAPYVDVTYPGTRRIIYAHEDSVWMTFHPTTETDTQKIEDEIIEKRDVAYELSHSMYRDLLK